MALTIPSRASQLRWKRNVRDPSWRSTYFAIAAVFNCSAFLHLAEVCLHYKRVLTHRFDAVLLALLVAVVLLVAAYLMWSVIRKTNEHLPLCTDASAAQVLLDLSHTAFRIYISLLGLAVVVLATVNLSLEY